MCIFDNNHMLDIYSLILHRLLIDISEQWNIISDLLVCVKIVYTDI